MIRKSMKTVEQQQEFYIYIDGWEGDWYKICIYIIKFGFKIKKNGCEANERECR